MSQFHVCTYVCVQAYGKAVAIISQLHLLFDSTGQRENCHNARWVVKLCPCMYFISPFFSCSLIYSYFYTGGGITERNLQRILEGSGAQEFHCSARSTKDSAMKFRFDEIQLQLILMTKFFSCLFILCNLLQLKWIDLTRLFIYLPLFFDLLMCRNTCVTMGAALSAPEYSLKVADVSKVRTLNAIARNTLWEGAGQTWQATKQIPQNWEGVIILICHPLFPLKPRRLFRIGTSSFFPLYNWSALLELREKASTLWENQSVKPYHTRGQWITPIFLIIRFYVSSE